MGARRGRPPVPFRAPAACHGPAARPFGRRVMTGETLDQLIVAQVRRTPGAVAVRQWDSVLTYRELLDAALPLAARLRAAGARPEACVGICTRRTEGMIVAVLGVLLSGAAYVPLDTDHPRQRLAAILD